MASSTSLCLSPLAFVRSPPSKLNPSFSWRNGALNLHKPSSLSTLKLKPRSLREPKALEVTKDSWEESILNSQIPVLVEFYASWCGPCRMVHRVINEIAEEYAGKLRCFVLNTDDDLRIAEDYEIKAVPVVLLFKNGVKRESIVGTMPKEFYIAAIERVMRS